MPNPAYSGPVKPSIDKLVLAPFTTDTAEFNVLETARRSTSATSRRRTCRSTRAGLRKADSRSSGANNAQLAANYNLEPAYPWGINYFSLNYTNPTTGPIFKQLYIRQAMQSLMNQTLWIQLFNAGYGAPTYGPVPVFPPTDLATPQESSNPYPYNPSHAKALLTSHGWKVVPNGVTTCVKPGTAADECGAGIPKGAQLSFQYLYESGVVSFNAQIKELAIELGTGRASSCSSSPRPSVTSSAPPRRRAWPARPARGTSPTGAVDGSTRRTIYPTGEEIFATGAGSNFGGYSDPTADALIKATNTSSSLTALYNYENYLAMKLPGIWQPETALQFNEVGKNVCGFTPRTRSSPGSPRAGTSASRPNSRHRRMSSGPYEACTRDLSACTKEAAVEGPGRTGRLVACAALILFLAFTSLAYRARHRR